MRSRVLILFAAGTIVIGASLTVPGKPSEAGLGVFLSLPIAAKITTPVLTGIPSDNAGTAGETRTVVR